MTLGPIPLSGVLQTKDQPSAVTAIYDHWIRSMDLPGRYVPLTVAAEDLEHVIRCLPKAGFVGLNVTPP